MSQAFLGIDVQARRSCSYYVCDEDANYLASGWLGGVDIQSVLSELENLGHSIAAVGVDAPRHLRQNRRQWYWRHGQWARKRTSDRGYGRHCEVVIAAHNLGSPQWTPLASRAASWLNVGLEIYR